MSSGQRVTSINYDIKQKEMRAAGALTSFLGPRVLTEILSKINSPNWKFFNTKSVKFGEIILKVHRLKNTDSLRMPGGYATFRRST